VGKVRKKVKGKRKKVKGIRKTEGTKA